MIELDQMKLELQQYETPLEEVRDSLDLDYKKQRIEELSRESEAPDFWNDADTANKKMKQLKDLQTLVEDADQLSTSYEDMMMLIEMGNEEDDRSVIETIREDLDAFKEKLEDMRLSTLLTGEYDDSNAIVSLNAGAGGTESCDWCSMLYRMYTRWACGRRRSGHQVRGFPDQRNKRLRISQVRERRAQTCPNLSLQRAGKETDLLCLLRCHARHREGY